MALMRTAILQSTIVVAAREGMKGFAVKSVAKQCGCSEGLVFHYFRTKQILVDTCYRYICDEMTKSIISEVGNTLTFRPVWVSFCRFMRENKDSSFFCLSYLQSNEGRIDGLDILKDSIAMMFPDKDEGFFISVTRAAAVIGCMYGMGLIDWDERSEDDYRKLVEGMVGGFR